MSPDFGRRTIVRRPITRVPVRPLVVCGVLMPKPVQQVAGRLALLTQSSIAPGGTTVADLVARGRFPHQSLIRQWTAADEEAVVSAMAGTGVTDLSGELITPGRLP